MRAIPKKHFLLILVLWAVLFLPHLGELYVNIMEARNFVTAREMLERDNWLLTTLNGQPRYEKPPLPTWLTAFSGSLFGMQSLFALRLPATLATLLMIIYFWRFLHLLGLKPRQALSAVLILMTSFYVLFMGRNGQWDIFTHGFMMAAIFYFTRLVKDKREGTTDGPLAAVFLGFSILSKGPVSFYALFLPLVLAYGTVFTYPAVRKKARGLLVWLLMGLAIGSSWFLYVRWADPEAFIEITSREAGRWTSYNLRPFYYYWNFFIQSGIWAVPSFLALLYPLLKKQVSERKTYRFSLLWTLFSVALLTLIPEKKVRYLLPVLIPMALNTSFYIELLFREFRRRPFPEKAVLYLNHGGIAIVGIGFPLGAFLYFNPVSVWSWFILTSMVLFLLGCAMLYYLWKTDYPKVFFLTIAFICALVAFGFPLSREILGNPHFRSFSNLREHMEDLQVPLYEYDAGAPEIIWDYGTPIPKLEKERLDLPEVKKFGLLVMTKDSLFISKMQQDYRILSKKRFDLNPVPPGASGYKERLVRNYYLLQKR